MLITVNEPSYHLQAVFFSELYASETRKLIERLVNYVIYKVSAFLFHWFIKTCHCDFILIILDNVYYQIICFLNTLIEYIVSDIDGSYCID